MARLHLIKNIAKALSGDTGTLTSGGSIVAASISVSGKNPRLDKLNGKDLVDGETIFVSTVKGYFVLDKTSAATVNGISVIAAVGGGRWHRLLYHSYSRWATQATWYIDPVNGNDENAGSTLGTAIKTLSEWCRRVGYHVVQTAMTVNILSDLGVTDTPSATILVGSSGSILFLGTPTAIYTSTGAGVTVTTAVPASNTPWNLVDTNFPSADWTAYIAFGAKPFRIRQLAGATAPGALSWLLKDLGTKRVRFSAPMAVNPAATAFGQSKTTIATGNPYVLEQLPTLRNPILHFNIDGGGATDKVVFKDVAFGKNGIITANITQNSFTQLGFYGCDLDNTFCQEGGNYLNCRFSDFPEIPGRFYAFIFGGCCIGNIQFFAGASGLIDQEFTVQTPPSGGGTRGLDIFGRAGMQIGSFAAFDFTATAGLTFWFGASGVLTQVMETRVLWGSGTGGAGVRVEAGADVIYDSVTGMTLTGTHNVELGTTNTAKTFGQLPFVDGPATTTKFSSMQLE